MRKFVLAIGVLGGLALSAVALGNGGATIASAPNLPVGRQVTGGGTTNTSPTGPTGGGWNGCCYGEFWRVPLRRGDHLRIDYGSLNDLNAEIGLYDPSITDYTYEDRRGDTLAYGETSSKAQIRYVAPKPGRFLMYVVNDCGACGEPNLAYELTAYVQHPTHTTLTGPTVARAGSVIPLRGKVQGLSGGRVAVQTLRQGRWKTMALIRTKQDGTFSFRAHVGRRGTYRARAIFFGDATHWRSRAAYSCNVV